MGDDGNVCTSVVEFNPKKEDDQKFLSCQARNELIDDIAVEDQWKITVYCKFINVLYISSFRITTHYLNVETFWILFCFGKRQKISRSLIVMASMDKFY